MALAGLKKQFNKANQYMNEKIGGVEGTKFTDEFTHLERRTDLTSELVDELINRTKEYLQPNPASRTKLMVSSKLKGAPGKPHSYPQPEGILGEIMCKYGKEINEDSNFSKSLVEMGEALREMSEVKYALEDNVKQNFLEPLTHLQAKDLKDVMFHRKKLEGRRLDYDCKKRKRQKGTHFSEEEIRMAEEKLEESYNMASMGMHNLLQNEIEQLSQICVLSEALYEYHSQCANILESLNARLMEIKNEAAQRSYQPYVPKKVHELNLNVPNSGHDDLSPGDGHMNGSTFYTSTSSDSSSFSTRSNTTTSRSSNRHNSTSSILSGNTTAILMQMAVNEQKQRSRQPESNKTQSSGNTLAHSRSLLNVSSWDDDPFDALSNSHSRPNNDNNNNNYRYSTHELLTRLNLGRIPETSAASTSSFRSNNNFSNTLKNPNISNNPYRRSSPSTSLSPSVESPPNKPTNLYLDTKSNANLRSPNARTPTERGPCCQALYDFDAENDNELSFKEGDIIHLVSQVDDNWYEGTVNGRTGLFPVSYVQILVPL